MAAQRKPEDKRNPPLSLYNPPPPTKHENKLRKNKD